MIQVVAQIDSTQALSGAAQFNRALDSSRSHVAAFDAGLSRIGAGLKALSAAFAISQIGQFAKYLVTASDDFLMLKGRIEALGTDGKGAEAVIDAIAGAAARARAPVTDLTEIYTQNVVALRNLGRSQEEGVRFAETLTKIGTIGGQSATSIKAALFQMSQGLSTGVLRGQEFNSVAEQMPGILRLVSEQTGKSAGELRKLANDGKLTADVLVNSVLNASGQVDAQFGKMAVTASSAASVLGSNLSRAFGEASEKMGVSREWAGAFNELSEAMGGQGFKSALDTLAGGLATAGSNFANTIERIEDITFKVRAWYDVLSDTTAYKTAVECLGYLGGAYDRVASFVQSIPQQLGLDALASPAVGALDVMASKAADVEKNLREVAAWQTRVTGFATLAAPSGARLPVQFGTGTVDEEERKRIAKVRENIAQLNAEQELRNRLIEAELSGDKLVETAVSNQLAITSRISEEMRKAAPEQAATLERRILMTEELNRRLAEQSEIQSRNREFADAFSSALTSGLASAIQSGKSFGETLKNVGLQLVEIVTQTALLKPLGSALSSSITGSLGGFDIGSIGTSLASGFGFANGGAFPGPVAFAAGGVNGYMGERGPEAIMPLKRDRNGALGVVVSGAGSGAQTNVYISVAGDATAETVEKLRRVAREEFRTMAPGVVRDSVDAVRTEHLADRNYLAR